MGEERGYRNGYPTLTGEVPQGLHHIQASLGHASTATVTGLPMVGASQLPHQQQQAGGGGGYESDMRTMSSEQQQQQQPVEVESYRVSDKMDDETGHSATEAPPPPPQPPIGSSSELHPASGQTEAPSSPPSPLPSPTEAKPAPASPVHISAWEIILTKVHRITDANVSLQVLFYGVLQREAT